MNNNYDELDKELINFNFDDYQRDIATAKSAFAADARISESKLCEIWRKVRKFIKPLTVVPVIGKIVALFVEVMDSICPS